MAHAGRMWVVSGAQVWSSADGARWAQASASAPFGGRAKPAVVVHGGRIWLLGGSAARAEGTARERLYPDQTTFNDVWSSADGAAWDLVAAHAPWAERCWAQAVSFDGRIWLTGGFSNRLCTNYAEAWASADGTAWEEMPRTPWEGRHEHAAYAFDGALWVAAGNTWPLLNDVWRLPADAVRATRPAPAPAPEGYEMEAWVAPLGADSVAELMDLWREVKAPP